MTKKITQAHPIIDLTLLNVAQNKALVLKEFKKSVHEHTISQKKRKKNGKDLTQPWQTSSIKSKKAASKRT